MWCLLWTAQLASAWDAQGATWPAEDFPLPYWVDDDFGPDLDDAAALAAVQAAFDTWAAVDCAGVTFAYQGRVSDATYGASDGKNVVFFVTDGWPSEASLVSAPVFNQSGNTFVDVDIALNGVNYAWSTDRADGRTLMDVQGSVTHEVGHLLGLWHSTVTGATLNPQVDGSPDARTLEQDDIDGICTIYDLVRGDGAQGDTCAETTDCADGLVCVADGADRYCATDCSAGETCPAGSECLDLGSGLAACVAPASDSGGCGCATGADTGGLALVVASAALALVRRGARPPHA